MENVVCIHLVVIIENVQGVFFSMTFFTYRDTSGLDTYLKYR